MFNPSQNQLDNPDKENRNAEARERLRAWGVYLEGEWTPDEITRILSVFQRLSELAEDREVCGLFNHQPTIFHRSGRPGRVGRTRGSDIFLDNDWTDWTLAHELGHRWNNAWGRQPEKNLRRAMQAGNLEWLKRTLRLFEKWLERRLRDLGIKSRLDWQALWYKPGKSPPPCGLDRNFNASEDLAESFAGIIFPERIKERAKKAAGRFKKSRAVWDWGQQFVSFTATARGETVLQTLRKSHDRENYRV